jgi:TRAP-type C4-dicarboxylate transport system permease small subunit
MTGFLQMVFRLCQGVNALAGVTLSLIMGITVTDVILRSLGRPIVGTFELVAFLGAVTIGFSIPFTSWVRGHIYVDFFILKLPSKARNAVHLATRGMGLWLFFLIGWNLIKMGADLSRSGEVSPTLQMPFYPVVYGVGVACFLQVLVLFGDIVKVLRGQYE